MNVELLVEEVKCHPELYDRNHRHYNNRERKQKLFDELSKKCHLNGMFNLYNKFLVSITKF